MSRIIKEVSNSYWTNVDWIWSNFVVWNPLPHWSCSHHILLLQSCHHMMSKPWWRKANLNCLGSWLSPREFPILRSTPQWRKSSSRHSKIQANCCAIVPCPVRAQSLMTIVVACLCFGGGGARGNDIDNRSSHVGSKSKCWTSRSCAQM